VRGWPHDEFAGAVDDMARLAAEEFVEKHAE
jgi:hypothetical protein